MKTHRKIAIGYGSSGIITTEALEKEYIWLQKHLWNPHTITMGQKKSNLQIKVKYFNHNSKINKKLTVCLFI